jgi:hypothetical protein
MRKNKYKICLTDKKLLKKKKKKKKNFIISK